jgi:hypothetical protein
MRLGDHIRTLANGRFDHAIDCGDMTVIHLFAFPGEAGRAEVRRSRLSDFTAGADRVEVVNYPQRGYAPRMVVARAFSRLGDSAAWAMFPSAEHFATWCVNGQAPAPHAGPAAREPPVPAPPEPGSPRRARKPRPKVGPSGKKGASRKARGGKPARRKAPGRAKAKRPARKARAAPRRAARKATRKRR